MFYDQVNWSLYGGLTVGRKELAALGQTCYREPDMIAD